MDASVRARIAYVAGRLVSGQKSTHLYDHSRPGYRAFSGQVGSGAISVYDYESRTFLTGGLGGFYDYSTRSHVSFIANGAQFHGYDYGSGGHFTGRVNGRFVQVYDYKLSKHFQYQV